MKILIIGTGAVSSVISKYLSRDKSISKIICASKEIKRAREFIKTKNPKIRLVSLDASNIQEIANTASGVSLIINASLPRFNENIMEAVL